MEKTERQRIEILGALRLLLGVCRIATHQQQRIEIVRRRIGWIERDGTLVFRLAATEIAIVERAHRPERRVCFGERRVESDSL